MNKKFKISLAQIEVQPGHPDINTKNIIKIIKEAKAKDVGIIVFPEMSVPGYLLGDEWENEKFVADCISYNDDILAETKGITAIWGNVDIDQMKIGEDGRVRKYNTAFIASNGKWIDNEIFNGFTYKSLMPKYREFDDERHFYSMIKLADERNVKLEDLLNPFEVEIGGNKLKIGLILCEDMWCMDYNHNPTKTLLDKGAELIVNISCSPWTWRKNDKRHRVVKDLMKDSDVVFAYCNSVGIQNNGKNIFLFDGGSTFYAPFGEIHTEAQSYQENVVDIQLPILNKNKKLNPPKGDVEELYLGLIYTIKKFFETLPSKKAVIGISGGIDSAVSVALLTHALGADNIYGVNMPTKFNSNLTRNAASKLANNLGINYAIFPIQESVDLTVRQLEEVTFKNENEELKLNVTDFIKENIQARDRGSRVLAGIAASLGAVFINNGNKTETALGYATLYGDINGAIAPLADLYKWEIYHLARYINEISGQELIPADIINIVPSAELSANQNVEEGKGDPINYTYHDKLLKAFIEWRWDPEDILIHSSTNDLEEKLQLDKGFIKNNFADNKTFIEDLEHKWKLYKINYFKRIQAPPIITVSKRAFGFDLREAQNGVYFTRNYLKLKENLL